MSIRSKKDLEGIRRAGRVVAAVLREMRRSARVGMTTAELDAIGERALIRHGARSAPRIIYGFPGACCISVNDEAVHGVPGDRVLKAGDLLKIDVTGELDGYIADAAVSLPLPPEKLQAQALAQSARNAFYQAIDQVRAGRPLHGWGKMVARHIDHDGFAVLKDLCGHGVGRTIHEDPRNIPNHHEPRIRDRFVEGTVIALEPIISGSSRDVVHDPDGWTIRTSDGSLAAHFEHTVLVTGGRPVILTAA